MESTSTESKNENNGQRHPDLKPEDQMVSAYLADRSEIYRDLLKVKDDVSDFKLPKDWYLFTDLLSRRGKTLKLPLTSKSKGNITDKKIQIRRNTRHSMI